jgi:branched-chain amino acid transport system substrate-binding protein
MRGYALALVGAVALAGPAAAAGPTQGVSDNEIKIGTYTDLSGVTAMWGVNNSNAWRMAFDEQNAKGGINGRKITYIVEDNQYTVPRSIQAENKLLNRDHVFIEVANAGTPMNNATMPMQLEKGVPNVFPLTAARSMYEPFNRLKFGSFASYYDSIRAGLHYFVVDRGKKKICAMAQDTDFGRDVMEGVRDQLKAEKLELSAETLHKPTDTDFSASVAKLRDADCDLVVLGTIVRDTNQIIASARKVGWQVDMLGCNASYDTAVADVPGGANEGYYTMTGALLAYPDDPRPAVRTFAEKYKTLFGRDPNLAAELGYSGAQVVMLALQNAGRELTVDSFIKGMEKIKGYTDIFGSPPLNFGPEQHHGSKEAFLVQVRDHRWQTVTPKAIGY